MDRVSNDLLLRTTSSRTGTPASVVAVVIDDRAIERFGPLPWPRDRLARLVEAVQDAGARAMVIDLILAERTKPSNDEALADVLAKGTVVLAAAIDMERRWLLPLDDFGGVQVAAHIYGEVGPDGVVRTFSTTKQADGLSLPALSISAARTLNPNLPLEVGIELRPEFRPAPQDLKIYGAAAALDGQLPETEISDRLVFVGIAATGAGDQFIVPTGPAHTPVPGVLAHASATASILSGRLLRQPGAAWSMLAALVLAFGVQLLRDRRGSFDLGRFALLIVGVVVVAIVAIRTGALVPVPTLVVAMVLSALLRETVESRLAHRETGRLLQAMLAHRTTPKTGSVPRTARGRLDALTGLQKSVLAEDETRRALLAGMSEGVVLWDTDGNVLESNPAVPRLWGRLPSFAEIEGVKNPDNGKTTHHLRGGRELSVDVADLGFGRLAMIRDITAERVLERRRREMQQLVSHELKTPLASIAGFGETLERYELSRAELSGVAAMIRGEAGRLGEMVTVFLDLERLGAGHWDDEVGVVDVGELVAGRLDVLGAAAGAREQTIRSSVAPDCRVSGVATLLDRVVDNLVGNAIKFTQPGDRIEITVKRKEDQVIMIVSDDGPGIPTESLERIFDRFYRVPGSDGSGAGLGLSLVRDVVNWHGGCMEIDSTPGVGSAFSIILPASLED